MTSSALFPDCDGLTYVPRGAVTWGAPADALVRVDVAEHHRRQAHGLGAVDRGTVNSMFDLPHGYWIRWEDLGAGAKEYRRWEGGILEVSPHGVRRMLMPPVTVELVVAQGLAWTPGLRRASGFAQYARRVLLLDQHRRIPAFGLIEADFWGVGVVAARPGRCAGAAGPGAVASAVLEAGSVVVRREHLRRVAAGHRANPGRATARPVQPESTVRRQTG